MLCPGCSTANPDNSKFCMRCGHNFQVSPQIAYAAQKRPWYQQQGNIVLFLIFFFPVGLFLMWRYAEWHLAVKTVVSMLFGFFVPICIAVTIANMQPNFATARPGTVNGEVSEAAEVATELHPIEGGADNELDSLEYKALCKEIDCKTLERDPNGFKGTNLKFTGEILQVMEPIFLSDSITYRVDVSMDGEGILNNEVIAVEYILPEGASRLLEDDMITLWGESIGLKKYETVLGAAVTIPSIAARYIERAEEAPQTYYEVGETASTGKIEYAINKVYTSTGENYNMPDSGNVFLYIDITAQNISSEEQIISSILLFNSYVDGIAIDESFSASMASDKAGMDGTVAAGKRLQGTLAYEVPTDWKEFEIQVKYSSMSDRACLFKVSP
ncbi:MAG: DUF4352 domain-containing protein [Acetanaerobacterium sp.]